VDCLDDKTAKEIKEKPIQVNANKTYHTPQGVIKAWLICFKW